MVMATAITVATTTAAAIVTFYNMPLSAIQFSDCWERVIASLAVFLVPNSFSNPSAISSYL